MAIVEKVDESLGAWSPSDTEELDQDAVKRTTDEHLTDVHEPSSLHVRQDYEFSPEDAAFVQELFNADLHPAPDRIGDPDCLGFPTETTTARMTSVPTNAAARTTVTKTTSTRAVTSRSFSSAASLAALSIAPSGVAQAPTSFVQQPHPENPDKPYPR